jgi:hypothetical protein
VDNTIFAANAHSLPTTPFRQRMLIRCGQHNLGSERSLATDNTIFVVNVNSLWTTQFDNENLFTEGNTIWQQNLIRCS